MIMYRACSCIDGVYAMSRVVDSGADVFRHRAAGMSAGPGLAQSVDATSLQKQPGLQRSGGSPNPGTGALPGLHCQVAPFSWEGANVRQACKDCSLRS